MNGAFPSTPSVVDTQDGADTVFSTHEGLTPFDLPQISADYM